MCVYAYACVFDAHLTVSEVKVRQIPPKPLKDTARKMMGDSTVE